MYVSTFTDVHQKAFKCTSALPMKKSPFICIFSVSKGSTFVLGFLCWSCCIFFTCRGKGKKFYHLL